jgi:hypothetical protein
VGQLEPSAHTTPHRWLPCLAPGDRLYAWALPPPVLADDAKYRSRSTASMDSASVRGVFLVSRSPTACRLICTFARMVRFRPRRCRHTGWDERWASRASRPGHTAIAPAPRHAVASCPAPPRPRRSGWKPLGRPCAPVGRPTRTGDSGAGHDGRTAPVKPLRHPWPRWTSSGSAGTS